MVIVLAKYFVQAVGCFSLIHYREVPLVVVVVVVVVVNCKTYSKEILLQYMFCIEKPLLLV